MAKCRMANSRGRKTSEVYIPNDNFAGTASRCGERSVWAEGDTPHSADVPGERADLLPGRGIVELHGSVVARCGQVFPAWVVRDAGEMLRRVVLNIRLAVERPGDGLDVDVIARLAGDVCGIGREDCVLGPFGQTGH